MDETDWHGLVKGMLKAEIKRRNMTYERLSAKLAEIGVRETTATCGLRSAEAGFRRCSSSSACVRWMPIRKPRLADVIR